MGIQIERSECTGCGCCVEVCPVEAIRLVDGRAEVYRAVCTECGDCIIACPSQAIALSKPESVGVLVQSGKQRKETSLERAPASPLQEVVPWAGAALMVLGKQVARNLAEALLAALEERTALSPYREARSRSTDGVLAPPRGKRGKHQRRRRRGRKRSAG